MVEKGVKDFLVGRRNLVRYVCPLEKALSVVDALLNDAQFRSLNIRFAGYEECDCGKRPLVEIEAMFAVKL